MVPLDRWLNINRFLQKTSGDSTSLLKKCQLGIYMRSALYAAASGKEIFWSRIFRSWKILTRQKPSSKTQCKRSDNAERWWFFYTPGGRWTSKAIWKKSGFENHLNTGSSWTRRRTWSSSRSVRRVTTIKLISQWRRSPERLLVDFSEFLCAKKRIIPNSTTIHWRQQGTTCDLACSAGKPYRWLFNRWWWPGTVRGSLTSLGAQGGGCCLAWVELVACNPVDRVVISINFVLGVPHCSWDLSLHYHQDFSLWTVMGSVRVRVSSVSWSCTGFWFKDCVFRWRSSCLWNKPFRREVSIPDFDSSCLVTRDIPSSLSDFLRTHFFKKLLSVHLGWGLQKRLLSSGLESQLGEVNGWLGMWNDQELRVARVVQLIFLVLQFRNLNRMLVHCGLTLPQFFLQIICFVSEKRVHTKFLSLLSLRTANFFQFLHVMHSMSTSFLMSSRSAS